MDHTLPAYAELCCFSNFSFLQGASHPEELVARAHALGYSALAITDDCSMAGVVRAHQGWQDAIRAGVPGAEAFRLMIGSSFEVHDEALGEQTPAFTLIVLACHRIGHGLLCEFITRLRRGAQGKGHATLWRRDIRAAELGDCVVLLRPRRGASADELLDQASWLRRLFRGCSWLVAELHHSLDDNAWLRTLPPLTGLRAFEAFARSGSMTRAAEELCVTHGAVSRQVRGLEQRLGVRLATGPRHDLKLTEAGRELARALSAAFDMIAAALPGAGPERELVVSCYGTFAMKWLIPRLPGFLAAHPNIPVRVAESNGPFDFKADGVDLAIRMRSPDTVVTYDSVATPFMEHFHGPVMAPELAASAPMAAITSPAPTPSSTILSTSRATRISCSGRPVTSTSPTPATPSRRRSSARASTSSSR